MMRSRLFEANAGQSFLAGRQFSRWTGTLTRAVGLLIESIGSMAALGDRRTIRVEADGSLARGALLFDTDYGTLDGSIARQLEEIESGLVDRLRRSAS